MKFNIILFTISFFILFLFNNLRSQTTFQKTYGTPSQPERVQAVHQTASGGYILTGRGNNNLDIYLVKTDVNGDTLWTKLINGSGTDEVYSSIITQDDGYAFTGGTTSSGAGGADLFVIKTDVNGVIQWAKTYGGTNTDQGSSIKQTSDGGYIIGGYTKSFGAGQEDAWLIKTDSNGDTLWTKTYGGIGYDGVASVEQTSDGGYILLNSTESFNAAFADIYLVKTNVNGDTLWTKVFRGTLNDYPICIKQTADGGYILTGTSSSFGLGSDDAFLMKTDATGNFVWAKAYGNTSNQSANCLGILPGGGYILAGTVNTNGYDAYLIRTNSLGDTIWTKTFGGGLPEDIASIEQTYDGGFIAAGSTMSYGAGNRDMLLVKTDSFGYSGCNITNFVTHVVSALPITILPATKVSAGATVINFSPLCSSYGIPVPICFSIGVEDKERKNIETIIAPNPFTTETIIRLNQTLHGNFTLTIYNNLGELMLTISCTNTEKITIERNNLQSGIYFYQLRDGKELLSKGKFVIE